jgi:hypothetical protein
MKPSSAEIARAVALMGQSINFFPTDDAAVEMVQQSLKSFVGEASQLRWLVATACNTMRRFSLPELRGIFCSRFPPADGLYTAAETPGFTPGETARTAEEAYRQRIQAEYEQKLIEWKREAKLLGQSPQPFEWRLLEGPDVPAVKKRPLRAVEPKSVRKRTPEENERLVRELQAKLDQQQEKKKA